MDMNEHHGKSNRLAKLILGGAITKRVNFGAPSPAATRDELKNSSLTALAGPCRGVRIRYARSPRANFY